MSARSTGFASFTGFTGFAGPVRLAGLGTASVLAALHNPQVLVVRDEFVQFRPAVTTVCL